MNSYVLVAIGSAIGGVARHWCNSLVVARLGDTFPWGTLLVNVSGSFLIGIVAAWIETSDQQTALFGRDLLMVGMLGGYTTFSAFSLQTLMLLRGGRMGLAVAHIGLAVACCLVAVLAGFLLARAAARG